MWAWMSMVFKFGAPCGNNVNKMNNLNNPDTNKDIGPGKLREYQLGRNV